MQSGRFFQSEPVLSADLDIMARPKGGGSLCLVTVVQLLPHSSSQLALLIPDRIHVNHRGFQVAMAQPLLNQAWIAGIGGGFHPEPMAQPLRRGVRSGDPRLRHDGPDVLGGKTWLRVLQ